MEENKIDGIDFVSPDWNDKRRCHDWRNYISEELREIWETFTLEQKRIIARNAQNIADKEEWD